MIKLLFQPHLKGLSDILSKGRYQKDKGLAFYKSGSRNILFRLEALCRIGKGMVDKKFFGKWYKEFKQLEDILGDVDHTEAMLNEFSLVPQLSALTKTHLQKQLTMELAGLTKLLLENGWYSGEKVKEFSEGLDQVEVLDAKEFRKELQSFLIGEIREVEKTYNDGTIDLSHLEDGLHELRRDLRWISIYAQVLDGWIQLRPVPVVDEQIKTYCTDDITSSPFNHLPKPSNGMDPLYVQSASWYALSWLIDHLGELKDIGLRYHVFNDLVSKAKFKVKTDKSTLSKKFIAGCKWHPYELSARSEKALDDFLYRDRIFKKIVRDLKRSCKAEE